MAIQRQIQGGHQIQDGQHKSNMAAKAKKFQSIVVILSFRKGISLAKVKLSVNFKSWDSRSITKMGVCYQSGSGS